MKNNRPHFKPLLAVLALGGLAFAPVLATPAGAAPLVNSGGAMSWDAKALNTSVPSGSRISYELKIECSNLNPDDCENVQLVLNNPHSSDGSTVTSEAVSKSANVLNIEDNGEQTVLTLKDIKPGESKSVQISWVVPNYVTLPGTELHLEGVLKFTSGTNSESNGIASSKEPALVETTASPAIAVTKQLISPADVVKPGDTAKYRLKVCLPGENLGQLDYKTLKLVDSLKVGPVEESDPARFIDLDGGTVSEDGRSLEWEIALAGEQARPTCGGPNEIVKNVSVHYPESIAPDDPGDGEVRIRNVVNNADATVTTIAGSAISGHAEVHHAFSKTTYYGSNHLQPYQEKPVPNPAKKGSQETLSLKGNVNWTTKDNPAEAADKRSVAFLGSVPCMQNVASGSPMSNDLQKLTRENAPANIFASGADYSAPDLSSHACKQPAFSVKTIDFVNASGSVIPEVRFTVYYFESGSSELKSKTVSLQNVSDTSSLPINSGLLSLPSGASVSDVLAVTSPRSAKDSKFSVVLHGVQSDAFAASDYMAQTNHFMSYLSGVATGSNLGDSDPKVVEFAPPNARTVNFVESFVQPTIEKHAQDDLSSLKPGDRVTWDVKVGNSGRSDREIKPTLYDVLPYGLSLDEKSIQWSGLADIGVEQPEMSVETIDIDGQKRQKVSWKFKENFKPSQVVSVKFETLVTLAASAGTHSGTQAQYSAVMDQLQNINSDLNGSDAWDLDGDGNTSEGVQTSSVDWTVVAESGATVEKFVRGSIGDGSWKGSDSSISSTSTDASGDLPIGNTADYRIRVSNDGTKSLQKTVVYDVLPYVGDTAIGQDLQGQQRDSKFEVKFLKFLSALPTNVTAQFSTSSDPKRPELFDSADTAGTGEWSDELPSDVGTIRSLRFVVSSLAPGQKIDIDFRGSLPEFNWDNADRICSEDTANVAWNNVAFQTNVSDEDASSLRAAEAPKVSVGQKCGLIGNFVWEDKNRNGIQDKGESPVEGALFELVDANGKTVVRADGSAVSAHSNAEGLYGFNVPAGEWGVKLVSVPDGYAVTTPLSGDDRSVDSNFLGVGETTVATEIKADNLEDLSLDLGLVSKVTPTNPALAKTGAAVTGIGITAGVLALLGAAAVFITRRRQH